MQQERRSPGQQERGTVLAGLLLALLAVGTSVPARAEDPPPPSVGLDRLLRVPDVVHIEQPRRGGATKVEWRARFEAVRAERDEAEAKLTAAREELEEKVGEASNWQMSAPGGAGGSSTNDGPVNYRLSQEIRRQREEVELAERRLLELRVEANLAGVPAEWMESGASDQP